MGNDKETQIHLSEADIDLIVSKVIEQLENKIYNDVGRGIMAMIWRGVIIAIIAIAGYGVGGHVFK